MAARAATAGDLLRSTFPGQVTTIDAESEFQDAVACPWSQTCWTPAAAYVQLTTPQEVTIAFEILRKTGSRFAVRTTGHNPNSGFSSTDEAGVVLDIRQLQSKSLDEDGIARVGAGNTWGEVFSWLEGHGLSAVGGRDNQVGLGGFLLGGGLGAFPNLHGVGVDSVRNFEVILADGRIVEANAMTNSDLYHALKGGGSNFGIVSRFDIEAHPKFPEDYVNIVKATIQVQEAMEFNPKIGLFTNFNAGFVAVGLLYADAEAEPPEVFETFHRLSSLMTTVTPRTKGTLSSLAQAMGHAQEPMKRAIATAAARVSADLYVEVHKAWLAACEGLPEGAVLHYTIQPVGEACVQIGEDHSGNIIGLEKSQQCWWVFTCEWPKDGCDDHNAESAVKKMASKLQALAREGGLLLDYLCMNFANASQSVLRSYGVDAYQDIRRVAEKYDPEGVFQKLQSGGFLLHDR